MSVLSKLRTSAKVTKEEAEEIREAYSDDGDDRTQSELGDDYGISQAAVSSIVRGETWRSEE